MASQRDLQLLKWSTFLTPAFDNGTTASALLTFAQGPSLNGNPVGPNHTLNAAAFVTPAPYTIGDAPRTISGVRNPSGNDLDFSAVKNTRWNDGRYNAQFRLEMFNALNHPNAGAIDTTTQGASASNPNIVTVIPHSQANTFANSARVIQLGFKFYF